MRWQDSRFKYRKKIIIDNNEQAVANANIKIELNSSNFDLSNLTSIYDIRFITSDSKSINHYIEKATAPYEVWLRVPELDSGTNVVYIYYNSDIIQNVSSFENTLFGEVDDLIAGWRFDDGSGSTAQDVGKYNYDATLSGPSWTSGKYGGALSFDGTNDYCYLNGSSLMSKVSKHGITVALWAYPDGAGTNRRFLLYGVTGDPENNIEFQITTGNQLRFFWEYGSGSNYSLYGSTVTHNMWEHYVFVGENGYAAIYRNGSKVGEDTSAPDFWNKNSDRDLVIGAYDSAPTQYWYKGKMDEMFIFRGRKPDSIITKLNQYYYYVPSSKDKVWLINKVDTSISYGVEEEYSNLLYLSTD